MTEKADLGSALLVFEKAREYISAAQLESEIEWQRGADHTVFTESDLLRESAWVVLCSGFRERTVRSAFDHISLCFCDWESATAIVEAGHLCIETARPAFRNDRKLEALVSIATDIHVHGFDNIKRAIIIDPMGSLQRFPFIGPITSQHLAKNLGFDVAKDDRHLLRISRNHGFINAGSLCNEIAAVTGEKSSVVDIVLWRYLADNPRAALSV